MTRLDGAPIVRTSSDTHTKRNHAYVWSQQLCFVKSRQSLHSASWCAGEAHPADTTHIKHAIANGEGPHQQSGAPMQAILVQCRRSQQSRAPAGLQLAHGGSSRGLSWQSQRFLGAAGSSQALRTLGPVQRTLTPVMNTSAQAMAVVRHRTMLLRLHSCTL